jgi:hypothetical protein
MESGGRFRLARSFLRHSQISSSEHRGHIGIESPLSPALCASKSLARQARWRLESCATQLSLLLDNDHVTPVLPGNRVPHGYAS